MSPETSLSGWTTLFAGIAALASAFAVVVSIISAYFAYQASKKASYVNVISSERIKWIDKLRDNVSDLYSLVSNFSLEYNLRYKNKPISELQKHYIPFAKELDKLVSLILLLLTPGNPEHEVVSKQLQVVNSHCTHLDVDSLVSDISKLNQLTRELIAETWREIKKEAK